MPDLQLPLPPFLRPHSPQRMGWLASTRRMAWLVLLALLLPLAQTVASVHLLSHVKMEQASTKGSDAALGVEHCNLCLNAAALTTGAPLLEASVARLSVLPQDLAIQLAPVTFCDACNIAYESRAPPSLPV